MPSGQPEEMRFSCLPVSLYASISAGERTLADWFRLAAALGLDGADISVAHLDSLDSAYLDGLRRQAQDAGMVIAGMVTYTDFTHPAPAERQRHRQELRRYIDAAARLGVDFLRVTAGQNWPGVAGADGVAWAADGLTAWVEVANSAAVTLVYENHAIGYGWTHFDFSQTASIFLEICERTAGSGLRILFDTANLLAVDDDPLAALELVLPRVAAVHASDIRRVGAFEPVVLGSGVTPLEAIFNRLRTAAFDGWLSVEEASKTGEDGFKRAIPYARALWRNQVDA